MIIQISGCAVVIDDEDYERVSSRKWYKLQGNNREHIYFESYDGFTGGRSRSIYLHKYIMGIGAGFDVDHINRDTCDNRKSNLRRATHAQNCWNQKARKNPTGLKGVTKICGAKGYFSRIRVNGSRIHLGCFDTPEEAHKAYCNAAIKYHGEYASFA
jgi:hypothetical protein